MFRVLVAGIIGGVIIFVWNAFTHMATPLGDAGIQSLPNESTLLPAIKGGIPESGMYMFPGMREDPNLTAEQQAAAWDELTKKYQAGPSGLIIIRTQGGEAMSPAQLAREFLTDLASAFLGAMLVYMAGNISYWAKVGLVTLLGLFALVQGMQLWNWYGFPLSYVLADGMIHLSSAFLAGLAIAAIVRPSGLEASAAARC